MDADVEPDGVREQQPVRDHAEGQPPDLAPDDEVGDLDPARLVHASVPQGGVEVLGLRDAADPECAVDDVVSGDSAWIEVLAKRAVGWWAVSK